MIEHLITGALAICTTGLLIKCILLSKKLRSLTAAAESNGWVKIVDGKETWRNPPKYWEGSPNNVLPLDRYMSGEVTLDEVSGKKTVLKLSAVKEVVLGPQLCHSLHPSCEPDRKLFILMRDKSSLRLSVTGATVRKLVELSFS